MYTTYTMGAYEYALNHYKGHSGVYKMVEALGYSKENLCVLNGDPEKLKSEFPRCYSTLYSCKHQSDSRAPIEYGKSLIIGWVFEDSIVRRLRSVGTNIWLSGADRERKILPPWQISSTSDCTVEFNGKRRKLELSMDYTNWWGTKKEQDFRDSKYNTIVREKALSLGILFPQRDGNGKVVIQPKYLLYDLAPGRDVSKIVVSESRFHDKYSKPARHINIDDGDLKPLDWQKLSEDINAAVEKGE